MTRYPWWPAMVLNPGDCGREGNLKSKLWLFWFGDHRYSEVHVKRIKSFKEGFSENFKTSSRKRLKKSVEEILHVLASMNSLKFQHESLIKWAHSGFIANFCVSFRWKKLELPQLVEDALSQRLTASFHDSDIDDAITEVWKGSKSLTDICIACCKENAKLIISHPLFIGEICVACKKDVNKACNLPMGILQCVCIICGQGGTLVYCSNSTCYRSFCQLCIEYLDSEKAYVKIVKDDNWLCYLCDINQNGKCLIQRRFSYQVASQNVLQSCKLKSFLNVIAFNETGLKVLKKTKIEVENYIINQETEKIPVIYTTLDDDAIYEELSEVEIEKVAPDLIMGSFFCENKLDYENSAVDLFFEKFFRFLYRVNTTRLEKREIFFIFIADGSVLDGNILYRIMRFLSVSPVPLLLGKKRILVWSNFSDQIQYIPKKFKTENHTDENTVEETILNFFVNYLLNFLKINQE